MKRISCAAFLTTTGTALLLTLPSTAFAATGTDGGDGGAGGSASGSGTNSTSGAGTVAGGNQVGNNATVNAPITACGVAAVLAEASCTPEVAAGNVAGGNGGEGGDARTRTRNNSDDDDTVRTRGGRGGAGGSARGAGDNTTTGENSLAGGNQIANNLTLNAPITVCGIGLLLATAECDPTVGVGNVAGGSGGDGGNATTRTRNNSGDDDTVRTRGGRGGAGGSARGAGNNTTSGEGSLAGGNQIGNNLTVNAPITVCGLGLLLATAECTPIVGVGNIAGGAGGDGGDARTTGSGNRRSDSGDRATGGTGGAGGSASGSGDNTTSGDGSLAGGLQVAGNLALNAPVTVCGIAVLGAATCEPVVTAGNIVGGVGGPGGDAITRLDGNARVLDANTGRHRRDRINRDVAGVSLPDTGVGGMGLLLPISALLIAGGVVLRRRRIDA